MTFEFVDNNTAIDRAARRRIRSHVAMGRNAGKKLTRPSRKEAFRLKTKTGMAAVGISDVLESMQDSENSGEIVPEIGRPIGDDLSVLFFPVQLNSGSRRLVQRGMYSQLT
jgi:hypothetical protein